MIEYDKSGPIYMQIATDILYQILSNNLTGKLGSMRILALEYSVTVVILNRALKVLEEKGVIEVKRGIGSFVTTNSKLLEDLKNQEAQKLTEKYLDNIKKLNLSITDATEMINNIKE